jgi:hypothetical protein
MCTVLACLLVSVTNWTDPSADEILVGLAGNSAIRHRAVYSGSRQYCLYNHRFDKSAAVKVRMTAQPSTGKNFTVVSRSGSSRMIDIIETLLDSETETSRPDRAAGHEIGPANYHASLKGSETIAGHDCWVLAVKPKHASKYLIDGTVWVDKRTRALVRLEGHTASRVSFWIGTPHIVEEFAPVNGVWLPVHTVSKSQSALLGESELDIRYTEYDVKSATPVAATMVSQRNRPVRQ